MDAADKGTGTKEPGYCISEGLTDTGFDSAWAPYRWRGEWTLFGHD